MFKKLTKSIHFPKKGVDISEKKKSKQLMKKGAKPLSEQAVEYLEKQGYLMQIRAEMKDEVMKCLLELEEKNEIPTHLKIKRYTPESDEDVQALSYIADFLRFHNLEHSLNCLKAEVNGDIPTIRSDINQSNLASAIQMYNERKEDSDNPLYH